MSAATKNLRPSLREERAEVTRRRIAQTARELFAGRGYAATTLQAIATEAEVAVQTIYAVFGSKAGILRRLRDEVLHQPYAEDLHSAAVKEPVLERKIELLAQSVRHRWESGHDVVYIHEEAARTDLGVRQEVDRVLSLRRKGLLHFAASLEALGIDSGRAIAILDVTTMPQVYEQLVVVNGWLPDEFQKWLASTLKQQLVGALSANGNSRLGESS